MKVNSNLNILYSNGKEHPSAYSHRWAAYRILWGNRPIDKTIGAFPLFLDLDVSTVCNFTCPTCSYNINSKERHFMNFDLFKSIIDEAVECGVFGIKFHTACRGEPLIHPRIVDMIYYAKSAGLIDVRMNTNGSLLFPDFIDRLSSAGLDLIIVSVDGSNEAEYTMSGRTTYYFDEIASNIQYFKTKRTLVRAQTINFPHVDQKKFIEFWSQRADEVTVIDYFDMSENRPKNLITKTWYCPMLFQRMSILWDGTMLGCNQDTEGCLCIGKIGEDKITDAWNSVVMNIIRMSHIVNAIKLGKPCNNCWFRNSEIEKEMNEACLQK